MRQKAIADESFPDNVALVRKHIDYADFRRLSAGLERAFIDDLKILTANPRNPQLKQERFLRVLEPAGFVSTVGAGLPSAIPGVSTEVNALGRLFQKCVLEE